MLVIISVNFLQFAKKIISIGSKLKDLFYIKNKQNFKCCFNLVHEFILYTIAIYIYMYYGYEYRLIYFVHENCLETLSIFSNEIQVQSHSNQSVYYYLDMQGVR